MPCEKRLKPQQTLSQRAAEIRRAVATLSSALATGRVKALVGKEGGVVFIGLTDSERDDVTDSCLYRRLMVEGSALAKAAVIRAEQMAGRTVDKRAIAQGLHAHAGHDGALHWHHGH